MRLFICISFFFSLTASAQTQSVLNADRLFFRNTGNLPADYYNSAAGLNCAPLKTALSQIISSGTLELLYRDIWATHPRTDKRRNDANTADVVWDMYSDNPTGPDPYTYSFFSTQCGNYDKEGDCYNREHTFPQSWFSDLPPMQSDIQHIFPTDGEVNGIRSNYPFGEVTGISVTTKNGSKLGTGNNFGYTGTVFEPINEYKGDIARAILYMAVRYETQIASWISNGNANEVLNGTSYQAFDPWYLKLLYKWHLQDPVSQKEINRNDSVFVIQKNRNPFIDRPEWVYEIWNCTNLLTTSNTSELITQSEDDFSIFPQPGSSLSGHYIQWNKPVRQKGQVQVFNSNGQILETVFIDQGTTIISLNQRKLTPGLYLIKVQTGRKHICKRMLIQ